ncbi:hypothetical protein GIB67_015449, partial [Kingdonia uniflora]
GSKFEIESTQAALGAHLPLPNVFHDYDANIPIIRGGGILKEKLPIRVHHHQSTWDLTKEPQVVQDFVKLKGLDRIGAISYNYYNSALISTFVEHGDAIIIGAWGAGNSLSLRKLKEHYAYKLEKVLSNSTAAAAKKKKGLIARSAVRAYMLYVLGSFLFPTKKGTDVSAWYLDLFAKDKVAKKWSWGSTVLAHMYYNLDATSQDDGRQFAC